MSSKIQITYSDASDLHPNPWNPNRVSPDNLDKIERSLNDLTTFKPVVVRERADGELEIVDGEHRTAVYKRRGEQVPTINLGVISDEKAKKITLAANAQYGENDSIALRDMLAEIGDIADLAAILPDSQESLEEIANLATTASDIDWDSLGVDDDEDYEYEPQSSAAPTIQHKAIKIKLEIDQAQLVESTLSIIMKRIGADDPDAAVNRGAAIEYLVKQHLESDHE